MAAFVVLHYQLLLSACTTIKSNPHAVQRSICLKSYKQRQKEILTQLFQIKKTKPQRLFLFFSLLERKIYSGSEIKTHIILTDPYLEKLSF